MKSHSFFAFLWFVGHTMAQALFEVPLVMNDVRGRIQVLERENGTRLKLDLSGFPTGVSQAAFSIRRVPFRYGYEHDPCRMLVRAELLLGSQQNITINEQGQIDGLLIDLPTKPADLVGNSVLISSDVPNVKDNSTSQQRTCANLFPPTGDVDFAFSIAKFTGPNVIGSVYLFQYRSGPARIFSYLSNANRFISSDPVDWHLTPSWERSESSSESGFHRNPLNCFLNKALKPEITLYNSSVNGNEGIVILANVQLIQTLALNLKDVYSAKVPTKNDRQLPPVIVLTEIPRFSATGERQIVGCASILPIEKQEAEVAFYGDYAGEIMLHQSSPFHPLELTANFEHLQSNVRLSVRSFSNVLVRDELPNDVRQTCSQNTIGKVYMPFRADDDDRLRNKMASIMLITPTGMQQNTSLPYATLFGPHSLIYRSIALERAGGGLENPANSIVDCATIVPTHEVTVAEALFHYPLAGRILFVQQTDRPLEQTSILVHLTHMFFSGASEASWMLIKGSVEADPESLTCNGVLQKQFNPAGIDGRNCRDQFSPCAPGMLQEKFGNIFINPVQLVGNVSAPRAQYVYMDDYLPLEGTGSDDVAALPSALASASGSISGQGSTSASIRVDWTWARACTNVRQTPLLFGEFVKRARNGSFTTIPVRQRLAEKRLRVSLDENRVKFVDELRKQNFDDSCTPTGTPFVDGDIKGVGAIMDRTAVIQKAGERPSCSRVELGANPDVSHVQVAIALFDKSNPIRGHVIFKTTELVGETPKFSIGRFPVIVRTNLSLLSGTTYEWYVDESTNCSACVDMSDSTAKPIYNPYLLNMNGSEYASLCSKSKEFFCAVGDLSSSLGNLSQPTSTFVNYFLPFAGVESVMGRSLVIWDRERRSCSCAPIVRLEHQRVFVFSSKPLDPESVRLALFANHSATDRWQADISTYGVVNRSCFSHSIELFAQNGNKMFDTKSQLLASISRDGAAVRDQCSAAHTSTLSVALVMLVLALTACLSTE